jgi:hypothetical protein
VQSIPAEEVSVRRIPFGERLSRPEPFLGQDDREARHRILIALENMAPEGRPRDRLRSCEDQEFRPGYLDRVRERISPKPKPEEPMMQLLRIVGETR